MHKQVLIEDRGEIFFHNAGAFDYNVRSEVTFASIHPNHYSRYHYDNIGNNLWCSVNAATNFYTANNLNQYTQVSTLSAILREPLYDADGNLLSEGTFSYTWDAENRLTAVYSNAICRQCKCFVCKFMQRVMTAFPPY